MEECNLYGLSSEYFSEPKKGVNELKTKNLNIEAQMADQEAIAAIEKLSGMYYSAYYDQSSIEIMCNPVDFMISGVPMKKRHLPPNYLYEYYRSSEFNGESVCYDCPPDITEIPSNLSFVHSVTTLISWSSLTTKGKTHNL